MKLNIKEKLVLETLAARYELGYNCWLFDAKLYRTLKKLAFKQLILFKYGKNKNTIKVWLTDLGIESLNLKELSVPITNKNKK